MYWGSIRSSAPLLTSLKVQPPTRSYPLEVPSPTGTTVNDLATGTTVNLSRESGNSGQTEGFFSATVNHNLNLIFYNSILCKRKCSNFATRRCRSRNGFRNVWDRVRERRQVPSVAAKTLCRWFVTLRTSVSSIVDKVQVFWNEVLSFN